MSKEYIWSSAVRGYELDNQGIVNNANYLHYFDQARILLLNELGINWDQCHTEGYDLVVAHITVDFKSSLKAFDEFFISSFYEKGKKTSIIFEQKLYNKKNNILATTSKTICVCISSKTGKPLSHPKLEQLLFS